MILDELDNMVGEDMHLQDDRAVLFFVERAKFFDIGPKKRGNNAIAKRDSRVKNEPEVLVNVKQRK